MALSSGGGFCASKKKSLLRKRLKILQEQQKHFQVERPQIEPKLGHESSAVSEIVNSNINIPRLRNARHNVKFTTTIED